ncbi:MAG: RecQ family ATP-dependent DNA helicase [Clostridia bacterium]
MPEKVLKKYFGYDNFRKGQEELVTEILRGNDVLGIMPTGAGKSLCFQVPSIVMDGISLVVSPLISLMQDQVKALIQSGIRAAYINSSLSPRQIDKALSNAKMGMYKIIYVAPERLLTDNFLSFAKSANISMLTVDEAHCISQWGQDFRPSYSQIPEFIDTLSKRPVVSAFTATATEQVKKDIIKILKLQNPLVLISGFDRENLYFEVVKSNNKTADLLAFLSDKKDKSGIIYCSTRKTVEEVCSELLMKKFSVKKYHAGLSLQERQENQNDFIYDNTKIMVATNAFGMGIDKSNVNFVVHYNMPKDMESYYQEAGRAGRDGSPAHCIMLYSGQDVMINRYLIENSLDTNYKDEETKKKLKKLAEKRLRDISFYSTSKYCLRKYILNYFGDKAKTFCDNCSNCNKTHKLVRGKEKTNTAKQSVPLNREDLFQSLRELRTKIAKRQSLPDFVIFDDSCLIDMCYKLPVNQKEFLSISGVSQAKSEKYSKEFVALISNYCNSKNATK